MAKVVALKRRGNEVPNNILRKVPTCPKNRKPGRHSWCIFIFSVMPPGELPASIRVRPQVCVKS